MQKKKILAWSLFGVALFVALLVILVWGSTFHPAEVQTEAIVCDENTPTLQPDQTLKILTYNVQYMAGRNLDFFCDSPNEVGPDEWPSTKGIGQTITEVARIIQQENPDIILLQEVDDGSKRTDYEDQLARLLPLLSEDYVCHTSAFYQQAAFMPRPNIMGAIGFKLSILSKYQIGQSTRYQLPVAPADPLTQQLRSKHAILEARLPVEGNPDFLVLNTHLEVPKRGAEVKQKEVAEIDRQLEKLNQEGLPWVLGGDFNLLPPGQFKQLQEDQKSNFRAVSEIKLLFDKYQVVPGLTDLSGDDDRQWLTKFINDPCETEPDRTLDYIFFADRMTLKNAYVRQHDTVTISDHFPVIAEFNLP